MPDAWSVVCNDFENNPMHWGYCRICGFREDIHDDLAEYDATRRRGGIRG